MTGRRVVFQGRRIDLAIDTVRLPAGNSTEREVVVHPGAVTIIPLLDSDRVCLVRNRRHAVGETLLELPAGTREPNEDPDVTAARELAEETGYRLGRLRRLSEFYTSPGILTERMLLYLAENLQAGDPDPEPGEELQREIIPWPQAVQLVYNGEIRDGKTMVGILYWDRLRGESNG